MAKSKKPTSPVEDKAGENISKEDLDNRRKEITSYYEENIPHLKIQKEYEELLRDIEKTRAERLQAQMFITKSMAEPPAPPAPPTVAPQQQVDAKKAFEKAKAKTKTVKNATK